LSESGISPTEFKVLVEPKPVATKIGSIHIPAQKIEKDEWATTEGRIVAIAPLAFKYASEEEWGDHPKPNLGDWVIFAKYAGLRVTGNDGKDYLLLNDKDLCAVRKA
jgi:co-chaperonin GroES (HSP10)